MKKKDVIQEFLLRYLSIYLDKNVAGEESSKRKSSA
jgi:hypothetical protein